MNYSFSAPHRSVKSLDLSTCALIKPEKKNKTGYIGARKRGEKKSICQNIATILPRPGKGFEFKNEIYPKMAALIPVLKELGYTAYRQGKSFFNKAGEQNRVIPLPVVAIAA